MNQQLERHLREFFSDDAKLSPAAEPLVEHAVNMARKHRHVRLVWGLAACVALVAATSAVAMKMSATVQGSDIVAGPSPSPVISMPKTQHGPLLGIGAASCVESYSPGAVAGRAFAFDGTVTGVEAGTTDRLGFGKLHYAAVTFSVEEWFQGGSEPTVTVDMGPPELVSEDSTSYGVGTRLLVSGEPRWGGKPLDDAIVWGCGFTRYYTPQTADAWREATSDDVP